MLDSGANVDCSPQELVQFARLGAVYAEDILGRHTPIVGLLSIGEEAEKGMPGVARRFDQIDTNKDGVVTMQELEAARKARAAQRKDKSG